MTTSKSRAKRALSIGL